MTGRYSTQQTVAAWKKSLRQQLQQARLQQHADQHAQQATALTEQLRGLSGTVCCYVPGWPEPGDVRMVTTLAERGPLWLPRLPEPGPGPLEWVAFTGLDQLAEGRFGLMEPRGTAMPAEAIATAEVVLVPALAISRTGRRLGKGGGYYDRSLALDRRYPMRMAVVRDEEVLPELPLQEHDLPMHAVVTPQRGIREIPLPE